MPRQISDTTGRGSATLPALDLLRWTSALAVAAGHLRDLLMVDYSTIEHPSLLTKTFYFATGFGHSAVVVFFVLSGYLVGGRLLLAPLDGGGDAARYVIDRASRIYMVLIPALALTAAVGGIAATWPATAAIFHIVPWSTSLGFDVRDHMALSTLACNLANLQSDFCVPYGHNGPLWSLSYEWFYYLTFPLLLWSAGWSRRTTGLAQVIGSAGLCAAGFVAFPEAMLSYPIWMLGAASRAVSRRRQTPSWALTVAAAGLVLCLVATRLGRLPGLAGDYAIAACLAVCLTAPSFFYRQRDSLSEWLSGFSYSLYAIHFPLCVLAIAAFQWMSGTTGRLPPAMLSLSTYTAILVLCSAAAWLFSLATERNTPATRRWLAKRFVGPREVPSAK